MKIPRSRFMRGWTELYLPSTSFFEIKEKHLTATGF